MATPPKSSMSGGKIAALVVGSLIVVGGVRLFATTPAVAPTNFSSDYDKMVVSQLTNASLALKSYRSVNNAYPTTNAQATGSNIPAQHVFALEGTTLVISTDGSTGYCIEGSNPNSDYSTKTPKLYDSTRGGLQPVGATCSKKYPKTYSVP